MRTTTTGTCALAIGACVLATVAAQAELRNTYNYGSVMNEVPLPPCQRQVLCNGDYFCADICVDGTVQVDPWFPKTFQFQRALQFNRSLLYHQWFGSHNSFISRANGLGLSEDFAMYLFARTHPLNATTVRVANQRYGVTDLLNFGIRHIEIDIWYLFSEVHVCHLPIPDPFYDYDLDVSAKALGFGNTSYDGWKELCSQIPLTSAATTILNWLQAPGNEQEIVGVFLDNRVDEQDIQFVADDLMTVFGSMLLTPTDLSTIFNGTWPNQAQMLAAGKRVFAESNSYYGNNFTGYPFTKTVFYPTLWDALQFDSPDSTPYPNCTIYGEASWYGTAWNRALSGSDDWAPDYSELDSLTQYPSGTLDLLGCGVNNIAMSDIGPDLLPGMVWTWAMGEPRTSSNSSDCYGTSMNTVRGRWASMPCDALLPAVCRNGDPNVPAGNNPGAWNFTAPVSFLNAASACASLGQNWRFDLPRDGRENSYISNYMMGNGWWANGGAGVWLNNRVQ